MAAGGGTPASSPQQHSHSRAYRLRATAAYCVAFVGLACVMSAAGPTLVALASAYDEPSAHELAPIFAGRGAGYFVGTLGMGWALEQFPSSAHTLLAASSTLLAAFAAAIPFAGRGRLPILVALTFCYSTAGGALDLGANALIVVVWGAEPGAGAAMNLLHFAWGLGSSLAPVIAGGIGLSEDDLPAVYTTLAAIALIGAGAVFAVPPPGAAQPDKADLLEGHGDGNSGAEQAAPKVSRAKFWQCMVCMFVYYFCYAAAEKLPGDWLATLAISRGASEEEGAHITGVYWGSMTGGRLLAVLIASYVSTSKVITADFLCCTAGCVLLLGMSGAGSLYASGAAIGLGLASLYPSGILLAQTRVPLSSKYISRFISGGTCGSMLVPAAIGAAMKAHPNALGWAELAFVVLQAASYLAVAAMPVWGGGGGGVGGGASAGAAAAKPSSSGGAGEAVATATEMAAVAGRADGEGGGGTSGVVI